MTDLNTDEFDIDDVFTNDDDTEPSDSSASTDTAPAGSPKRSRPPADPQASATPKRRRKTITRGDIERHVATALKVAALAPDQRERLAKIIGSKDTEVAGVAVALLAAPHSPSPVAGVVSLARMDEMTAGVHAAAAEREELKAMWAALTVVGAVNGNLKTPRVEAALQVASAAVGLSEGQLDELERMNELVESA